MSEDWLTQEEAAKYLGMNLEKFKERGPAATSVDGKHWLKRNLILWKRLYARENQQWLAPC